MVSIICRAGFCERAKQYWLYVRIWSWGGVELTEAVKWYRLAEQGNEYGQKNLGVMHEYGRGVGQSLI